MGDDACSLGAGLAIRGTDKALLVRLATGREVWIPQSVIHDDSEVFDAGDNARGRVVVKAWFAEKEGLDR